MEKTEIGKDIQKARRLLGQSELVAIPTETVYGLAANAFDASAVLKIFQVKNRPAFDPLITHTDSLEKVQAFVQQIPRQAFILAENFWPGPLTLLLQKKDSIPDLVTSGLPQVAVRIPCHPLALSLLSLLDFPLAAPSANPFGYISPTTAQHVQDQLGGKISYILDGGESEVGIESTIIGFENEKTIIYRLGGISVEAIEETIGKIKLMPHTSSNPKAPGMILSHYAPKKTLLIGDIGELMHNYEAEEIGILSFRDTYAGVGQQQQITLSEAGDIDEAARNLFASLRKLDNLPIKTILAEFVPDHGLGRAINDRLRRAASH